MQHYAQIVPLAAGLLLSLAAPPLPHGTVISPLSRVYRVYQSNPGAIGSSSCVFVRRGSAPSRQRG